MIGALLRRIPLSVYVAVAAALAVIAAAWALDKHGYDRGVAVVEADWAAERAQLEEALAKEKQRQSEIVVREVVKYRDRIQVVKERGDEIVQEIPVLIPMDGPVLSGAFRVLHDAAASNQLPPDPAAAAATAAPVEAAALLRTAADNYSACHAELEKLVALQTIFKEMTHVGDP